MDPPLTTPEAFIQQVAWLGVQPSTDWGGGGGGGGGGEPAEVRKTTEAEAGDDIMADLTTADHG